MDNYRYYLRPTGRGIKLHLGCGDYWFDGYLNIDQAVYGGTDMLYDIRKPLPFNDKTVEIIELHDVFEHFGESDISNMLNDWYRILIDGGKVFATLPDIDELTKKYLESTGDDKAFFLRSIYGIEGDHKAGYTKTSIVEIFEKHKYKDIQVDDWVAEPKKDDCPRLQVIAYKRG
jgi:predicted SAM-dependent methyltransferase